MVLDYVFYYVFFISAIGSIIISIAQFITRGFIGNFTVFLKMRFVSALTVCIAGCSAILLIFSNIFNNTKFMTDKTCIMIIVLFSISTFVNGCARQTKYAFFKDEAAKRIFYEKARTFAEEYATNEFGKFGPETYCPICSCEIRNANPHYFKCPNCGFEVNLNTVKSNIQ